MKNFYFNNFDNSMEQMLIEQLVIESIKIYGVECWYIRRSLGQLDDILNEDDVPTFEEAINVEMYVKNVDGFGGEGDFLSKFGLEIRDQITFTIAKKTWEIEVGQEYGEDPVLPNTRPFEGDLIWFPLNGKVFEIQHVEHEAIFYQMGSLQTYDLRCELFEYSNEIFNTGVPGIDNIFALRETRIDGIDPPFDYADASNVESIDKLSDNYEIEKFAGDIIDFTEDNPFGEEEY